MSLLGKCITFNKNFHEWTVNRPTVNRPTVNRPTVCLTQTSGQTVPKLAVYRPPTKEITKEITKERYYYLLNAEFSNLWKDFVEMRKKIRAPMTDMAKSLILNKLHKWPLETAMEALKASIEKSWRGVFEPKNTPSAKKDPIIIVGRKEIMDI